jgi:type II restriction/modification system DNA methylase subunit YeeA
VNTSQLSAYAPAARTAFMAAVSAQAATLGITAKAIADAKVEGDVLLIEGQAFPKEYASSRSALVDRVRAEGFEATMEAIAYTWFNRFAAIRYMELHGYLDHGYRVLSDPDGGGQPEILDHAAEVDLPGLDKAQVVELKLDGTQDEALYRLLLKAQCNALHQAMPFLFEEIGGADELLHPANLLHTDSLIRQLVESIDEDLWQDIEIIGWLYQFYISERKDEVIGKVVKSEDIPAATQLFTPNWIVKYMVQNSLGAQWLATYPQSPLKGQMEYYIEPAEQTDEVNAQLASITPSQLNPEELTLIDPASGSGHILVEAYELFKAIYLERGYRQRDVPQLILTLNLFGLDIDERAAQLTGFALMMKGRADDRRLFERGVKLNVMALVDSAGFDSEALAKGVELSDYGLKPGDLTELKQLFEHATTFGSLIQVPEGLAAKLPALKQLSEVTSQDLFVSEALKRLGPLVQQAELLAAQYDAVVANPPYMGTRYMNSVIKKFTKDNFPHAKADLFACFIVRGLCFAREAGQSAMVTMQGWMFLSSFEKLRQRLLQENTITTMAHLGARAFGSISGEVVQTTVCTISNRSPKAFKPVFSRLLDGGEAEKRLELLAGKNRFGRTAQNDFSKLPGSPIAYWASEQTLQCFENGQRLGDVAEARVGLQTNDVGRFLRKWHEVSSAKMVFGCEDREQAGQTTGKWFPHHKGGEYRRWYGNNDWLVNWEADGREIYALAREINGSPSRTVRSPDFYFRPCLTWTDLSSGNFAVRVSGPGHIFDISAPCIFPREELSPIVAGFLCSSVALDMLRLLNSTFHFLVSDIASLPYLPKELAHKQSGIRDIVSSLTTTAIADWDAYERSWDFQSLPLLTASSEPTANLESSYTAWTRENRDTIAEMKRLEEENNRLFIDAYGLQDELTPDVPLEQITLTVNPAYRYGGKLTEEEQWTRFRQDTMEELVSFGLGCMMGRYSLDEPGLIYAHSGNEGFDPSQYTTFPADDDGIVPLTDTEWFEDDACNRAIEFLSKTWNPSDLEANLTFLADNLSPKKNESNRDTIRSYINDKFFKDHLQTYKKRPIYWLFSSGKQKAFQCLVYLHRYNEGTLSRMRSEYVIPLQGKMAARLEKLQGDIQAATSTAQSKRLEKERAKLDKQQHELLAFDEKLRHYADMRITLDLDDGVKVNYGEFGDLLAEVKAVHGQKAESA